ncbi:MAG: Holliday junction branch migration DNA helicase RuvB [Patescibacteria group bacterium]|jgi:Holliday junction DNA helicase RuvB
MANEVTSPKKLEEDLDQTLRPRKFSEFIGQDNVKKNLDITLKAAKRRKEPCDHMLIYGPPGLGKTTLANIVASEMNAMIKITSGPAIERTGDLASILTNLNDGDFLFIDEIHRLNRSVEEVLYPAMEDYALDLMVGKGPSAKILRLDLPHFTLIGATTKIGSISSPMRDRFGVIHRLDFYEREDIERILKRSANILNIEANADAISEIANRSRLTPRIANRLLKRVRDFAEVESRGKIDLENALLALDLMQIDSHGLDMIDLKLLETIIKKFSGGPVGLNTISSSLAEDPNTVEEVNEPFLLRSGYIMRTPKGRVATDLAYTKLGMSNPKLI